MVRNAVAIGAAVCCCFVPVRAQQSTPLSSQPGGVVRVEGTARLFGKTWDGLIGIDLETKPGSYPVSITPSRGATAIRTTLTVAPAHFTIRRLKVSPEFVTPPESALNEIAEEAKKTEGIFSRVGPRHWMGPFVLPIEGQPTSNFGTRSYYNGQRRSAHAGVDFLSPSGTPIRAGNNGVIALAEPLYFTGNTVIVDYGDGLYSLFAHLSEFRVHEGDVVKPDTIVGLVGATGRVTGPHLHWGVRLQRARVDPMALVNASRTQ
jgi:murein DD-endopeptidase MepM/ murein hydrolase activator NlpD